MTLCPPVSTDPYACALLTYRGNVIAIDLIGAGIPVITSLLFLGVLYRRRGPPTFRRIAIYTILTLALGLAAAGEFTLWSYLYGGISVSGSVLEFTVLLPIGIAEYMILDRMGRVQGYPFQSYIIGTFGMFMSDVFRTLGGFDVTPQIYGAGEFIDGVFVGGIILMFFYVTTAFIYLRVYRRTRG